jgi:hypothetical protein
MDLGGSEEHALGNGGHNAVVDLGKGLPGRCVGKCRYVGKFMAPCVSWRRWGQGTCGMFVPSRRGALSLNQPGAAGPRAFRRSLSSRAR